MENKKYNHSNVKKFIIYFIIMVIWEPSIFSSINIGLTIIIVGEPYD